MPEDTKEHLLAIHGADFNSVCWDLDQDIRNWVKHGNKFDSVEDALRAVRVRLLQLMEDKYITLDMSC